MTQINNSRNPFVEFQAIVLAGGSGNRLEGLVSKKPKAMLSVANKPLIFYPIQNLINHHFGDIIVVVKERDYECIAMYIQNEFMSVDGFKDNTNIRVLPLPPRKNKNKKNVKFLVETEELDEIEEELGTAEVLFYCKDYIYTDFFVLSCDVVGFIDLYALANIYRVQNCCCAILYVESDALKAQHKTVNQLSNKQNIEEEGNPTWVALDESTRQVLAVKDGISMSHGDKFEISKFQLYHNNNLLLTKDFLDLHVYIFKHSVMNTYYLHENHIIDISSIKFDLIPLLTTLQNTESASLWDCSRLDCDVFVSLLNKIVPEFAHEQNKEEKSTNNFEVKNDHAMSISNFKKFLKSKKYSLANPPPLPKKGAFVICHIQPLSAGLACRVNTVHYYHQINMQFCRHKREELQSILPTWMITQINSNQPNSMRDSVIAERGSIENNVVLKKSVVGSNVKLESGVRISNCVLMNNVSVGKNSILQQCVISDNVVIESGCKLTSCLVEENYKVVSNTKAESETLPSTQFGLE